MTPNWPTSASTCSGETVFKFSRFEGGMAVISIADPCHVEAAQFTRNPLFRLLPGSATSEEPVPLFVALRFVQYRSWVT